MYCGGQPLNTDVRVCYDRSSHAEMLTQTELQAVTTVFRNFETGLREASIDTKVTAYIDKLGKSSSSCMSVLYHHQPHYKLSVIRL